MKSFVQWFLICCGSPRTNALPELTFNSSPASPMMLHSSQQALFINVDLNFIRILVEITPSLRDRLQVNIQFCRRCLINYFCRADVLSLLIN